MLQLLSWNVNGIRAVVKKGFETSMSKLSPDVICMQEVRANPGDLDLSLAVPTLAPLYPTQHWNPAVKKGYSGTMVLANEKAPILTTERGLKTLECFEGRVLSVDLGFAILINVYTPNAGRELIRLPYRTQWDRAFIGHVLNAQKIKPVIICGDLNVAHQEIDLARPKANKGMSGFTVEERTAISTLLSEGKLVDSFRYLHGEIPGKYTWWSNMGGARAKNIGWRIDYFLVDQRLAPRLKGASIHPDITGSDHCPVSISLNLD